MSELTILFSAAQIDARVEELAQEIDAAYQGIGTIHLIGVLRGGFIFISDLARKLKTPVTIDFAQVSSYSNGTHTTGTVSWQLIPDDVRDQHTIIVEDIVDTGITLDVLRAHLLAQRPASLRVVTLLNKPHRRQRPIPVDFTGFIIDDEFVVGYGLDLAEKHRELPYIATLSVESRPRSWRCGENG